MPDDVKTPDVPVPCELRRAYDAVRKHYEGAIRLNETCGNAIRNPAAWALYQAWREIDGKKE